jgi:8-oxo-dGTP pyrophosphatase MutT (NUDIX family)
MQQPIQIKPIETPITLHFDGEKVMLPDHAQEKVNEHWRQLVHANPRLHNGEVFTVVDVQETAESMDIQLAETDYAHYLYTDQIADLDQHNVRIIHTSALPITSDNKLIFGAMARHTGRPGVIQCCGGGIDHDDITSGVVDIEHNTAKELREELGIDPYDEQIVEDFSPVYLKSGGRTGKLTVAYLVRLSQTGTEFLQNYETFARKIENMGEEPEFGELFSLDADEQSIDDFISSHADKLDEYMPILLRAVASNLSS